MANINNSLTTAMSITGALAVAVVDLESGMTLGQAGGNIMNMEIAAAGNTEVVRAKMRTMADLDLNDEIDDILITLGKQYHIIRPSTVKEGVFIYFVLDKARANLAMARRKTADVDAQLSF